MENLKVRVTTEQESKEVQALLFELGYKKSKSCRWLIDCIIDYFATDGDELHCWDSEKHGEKRFNSLPHKQITLQYLRHLVVLKRNSIDDATHYYGGSKYYLTDSEFYQYSDGKWVNIDEYVDGMTFKKIDKDGEVKMKEYLELQEDGSYEVVLAYRKEGNDWIEVPEGSEKLLFSKTNNNRKHFVNGLNKLMSVDDIENRNGYWYGNAKEYDLSVSPDIIWQRSETENTEQPTGIEATHGTSTKEKLKFIEKWLNGEKIQYILGIETDKSQWHNFTEGAVQYIKRSDIKFREAPKYVTINGIEFKSVEKLVKYVKNNFDLEYGE